MITKFWRSLIFAASAAALSSCYYPAYDAGYSSSYGYSSGGTAFIHTSSDRWFYDSTVRCYYDRTRHAYYDPWLNGYYPRGYCPQPVVHVPHPYGWSGHGVCPTPRGVSYRPIDRYHDRIALLKAKRHEWARNVKEQHRANARAWQDQRAHQAAQFTAHRRQNNQGWGFGNNAQVANRNDRDRDQPARRGSGFNPSTAQARPTGPTRPQASLNSGLQPSRPQYGTSGRQPTRPQATSNGGSSGRNQAAPPRKPSRPTPQATRPGYNQPVKTTPTPKPKAQPSSRGNSASNPPVIQRRQNSNNFRR